MAKYETYVARAKVLAPALEAAAAPSPFTIEVRFLGGLTDMQKQAFKLAADRWTKVIVGDLPAVTVNGEAIDDLLILAQGDKIDGPGRVLGQAGPTHLRPANAGSAAFLPAKGRMTFDSDDLADMEKNGTLNDVITHEMGHVIGIGTIWTKKNLLDGAGSNDPRFTGSNAKREYGKLRGGAAEPVPVENSGGPGTRDGHWRETVFFNELMSGFISDAGNPISRLTIACLQDLGYTVDYNAAEPYSLPKHLEIAEAGLLLQEGVFDDKGFVLPILPSVLPPESLS